MRGFLAKLFSQEKLKLVEPSANVSKSYMEKSVSNFDSAKILLENNKFEESVSFVYYSMYNLVLSLLYYVGIKSENHSGSLILLKEVFGLDSSSIVESKKERIDKQYYVGFSVAKKEVEEGMRIAENFNRDLRGFILGLGKKDVEVYRSKFLELLDEK